MTKATERTDISKLWQLEEIAAAGHHELVANLRTAIGELEAARARLVSCEACNGMAKRVAVLEEECRASRQMFTSIGDGGWFASGVKRDLERLSASRRATDENGGLA